MALWLDHLLLLALTLTGLFSGHAQLWYVCLLTLFAAIAGPVLAGAGVVTLLSARFGVRIQGPRRASLIGRGIFHTSRAAWVAACFGAWPLMLIRLGQPNGMVWTLTGSPWAFALQTGATL